MISLLKIEWLKIKNYTAFIVLGLFFIAGVPLASYIFQLFKKNVIDVEDPTGLIASITLFDFDRTWQTSSYIGGCLLLLPSLLLMVLLTNEFSYRTHRQNIIDGISRSDFFHVKVILAFIMALVSAVLVAVNGLVFGIASGSSFSLTHFDAVGFFFLKAFSYFMIAILLSVLIRKTGFAIGLFFVYLWFENFLSLLLEGLSYYLKKQKGFDIGNMGDYLPMNASDAMVKFPQNTVTDIAKNASGAPHQYPYLVFGLAIAYLLLFYLWSKSRIIKTDL